MNAFRSSSEENQYAIANTVGVNPTTMYQWPAFHSVLNADPRPNRMADVIK